MKMELKWIYTFLAIDGFFLVGFGLMVLSMRRTRRELKARSEQSTLQTDEVRESILALRAVVTEIRESAANATTEIRAYIPAPVVTLDQRAGALQMFRRGADADAVAMALGVSQPEAALLKKVQRLLEPDPLHA
jgi:hypothetical protein